MAHNCQNHTNRHSSDDKFTIVLLGSQQHLKSTVGSAILKPDLFNSPQTQCVKKENEDIAVISTPDECNIEDLIAASAPGPHAFLLVLAEGEQPEAQLDRWEKIIRQQNMYHYTIVIMDTSHLCKDSKMADRCLDINIDMEGLGERCKNIWRKSIHRRYSYTKYDTLVTQVGKRSSGMKKPRKDAEGLSIGHDREATQAGPDSSSMKICLLGETGSGKSASGNTILGSDEFPSKTSGAPVTTRCQSASTSFYGTEVKVIDTPDFFDEDLQQPSRHVMECRQMCEGDLCVYLLVIQIGRFTEGERGILKRLEKALETKIRDRAIILFTHGDDLGSGNINDYVSNTNTHLQELIKKCGGRYQVFNNRNTREAAKQKEELGEKIAKLGQEIRKDKFTENKSCIIA